MPFLRTPFNYDRNEASKASGLSCSDPTRTQQQFAEEVDINTIVRNFGLTGQLPDNVGTPLQGDFTEVYDYQSALNMVMAADAAFMEMPSGVRKRFDNDPQAFLDFVSDPANLEEARALGLANPLIPPAKPMEVVVVPNPTSVTPEPAKA